MSYYRCKNCGRKFYTDYIDSWKTEFCSEECRSESWSKRCEESRRRRQEEEFREAQMRSQKETEERARESLRIEKERLDIERKRAEQDARDRREHEECLRKLRREQEERAERERKNDPSRWYGSEWAEYLAAHPDDSSQCNWTKLSGDDWMVLLIEQPQFFDKCTLSKLTSENVRAILVRQPSLASDKLFAKLDAKGWAKLLQSQPQFSEKCDCWDEMTVDQWVELIKSRPQFAEKCHWSSIPEESDGLNNSAGLRRVLEKHPELADKFDLSVLSAGSWARLLQSQPGLSKKCDKWDAIDADHWVDLLKERPEFVEECNWSKVKDTGTCSRSAGLRLLLEECPDLADKCDLNVLSAGSWARLLQVQPGLSEKCDKWEEIDVEHWLGLLKEHPEFVEKCNWSKVKDTGTCSRSAGLRLLLEEWPDLADKCDLNVLSAGSWARLLQVQPGLSEKCDKWDEIDVEHWLGLLEARPQFDRYCKKFSDFTVGNWIRLITNKPQFAEKCNRWKDFDVGQLIALFKDHIEVASSYDDWSRLTSTDWCKLLIEFPALAEKCKNWVLISSDVCVEILKHCPQFSNRMQWERLNAQQWCELLDKQPSFACNCSKWSEFTGDQLCKLICTHVEVVKICNDLDALWGNHWCEILKNHPQLANKCDWYSLTDADFRELKKSKNLAKMACEWNRKVLDAECKTVNGNLNAWDRILADTRLIKRYVRAWRDHVDKVAWHYLLIQKPELVKYCQCKENISWGGIVDKQPSLMRVALNYDNRLFRDWWKFPDTRNKLIRCLLQYPEVLERQVKKDFNTSDWLILLKECPQFVEQCPVLSEFGDYEWYEMLVRQPQLAKFYNFDSFRYWDELIKKQPSLKELYKALMNKEIANLSARRLLSLSTSQKEKIEEYSKKIGEKKFLASVQRWEDLSLKEWVKLLLVFPKSERYFVPEKYDWKTLTGEEWVDLLWDFPRYKKMLDAPDIDWNVFTANDWPNLLFKFPEYKGKCDVEKIDWTVLTDSFKWGRALMCCSEQIIGHFSDWESIEPNWWPDLVKHQPKLKPYRKKYDKHLGFWGRLFG